MSLVFTLALKASTNTIGIGLGNGDRSQIVEVGNTVHWCHGLNNCHSGFQITFDRNNSPCDSTSSDLKNGLCVIAALDSNHNQTVTTNRYPYKYKGSLDNKSIVVVDISNIKGMPSLGPEAFIIVGNDTPERIDHAAKAGDTVVLLNNNLKNLQIRTNAKFVGSSQFCTQGEPFGGLSGGGICAIAPATPPGDHDYNCKMGSFDDCADPTLHIVTADPSVITLEEICYLFSDSFFHGGKHEIEKKESPITLAGFFSLLATWAKTEINP